MLADVDGSQAGFWDHPERVTGERRRSSFSAAPVSSYTRMRRPSLVYSPGPSPHPGSAGSSRRSSRSSTPPAISYFEAFTVPPKGDTRTNHDELPKGLSAHDFTPHWRPPSLAAALHYLSLALSFRLVLRRPHLATIALALMLALSLEGRAKAERLGLRTTMCGLMGAVGFGVALGNVLEPLPQSQSRAAQYETVQAASSGETVLLWLEGSCTPQAGEGPPPPDTQTWEVKISQQHQRAETPYPSRDDEVECDATHFLQLAKAYLGSGAGSVPGMDRGPSGNATSPSSASAWYLCRAAQGFNPGEADAKGAVTIRLSACPEDTFAEVETPRKQGHPSGSTSQSTRNDAVSVIITCP